MKKTIYFACILLGSVFSFAQFAYAQHEGLDWFANGERHKQQARYDLALQEYDKAVQREPRNHLYLFSKAQCEYQLKRPKEAANSLSYVIRLNSSYSPAYALLAKIYADQNDNKKAAQLYDIAARYESEKEKRQFYRFFVIKQNLAEKNWATAFEKIKLTKTEFPKNLELYYLESQVANYLGKYAEAVKAIETIEPVISSLHPSENARYYYQKGYAYYHLDNFEEAFKTWSKAKYGNFKSKIEEFSPARYAYLAEAYTEVRQYNEAQAYAQKALKIDPNNASAYFTLANLQNNKAKSDVDKTLELYYKSAKFEKDLKRSTQIYEEIASLELSKNNFENALKATENGLTFNSGNKNLLYLNGLALFHLHKNQEAAEALQKALAQMRDPIEHSRCMFLLGLAYRNGGKLDLARRAFANIQAQPFKIAATNETKLINQAENIEETE
ncbi:tetratricopeptide repeat protein [Bernardetia sp.]|uniref:tetratricopeptide repeat protein n=1 Tax=Bernardetia sp. TaxID=1937974 RepID=UPI0025C674CF|nr:tetratricopeptide repeat protein [Bernardetia sp.]